MRCSPRWRTSSTRRVAERAAAVRAAAEAVVGLVAAPRIVPGSQCAPWMTHGTMCSRRQNDGAALALGLGGAEALVAARPATPHQLHGRLAHGAAEAYPGRWRTPRYRARAMTDPLRIVVLEGDETGQELLEQALRVLDPDVVGLDLDLQRFDLSLEHRRATGNAVVDRGRRGRCARPASASRRRRSRRRASDDVGSPNRILREEVDGKVIIRTGRRIPGVTPIAGVHHPISVVRMAVEDAYGAEQWREGAEGAPDEVAYRTEKITRSTCRAVAEYAFRTARARWAGASTAGPKWTVSPVYEGMLKEELDAAAERHPDVPYQPVLIDATYAGLIGGARRHAAGHPGAQPRRRLPERPRDADVRLDRRRRVGAAGLRRRLRDRRWRWPRRRTARRRRSQGKDIANPMAMILACAAVLHYAAVRGRDRRRARLARDLRVGARGDARRACARRTSAATRRRASSRRRRRRASGRRSTSGRRSARRSSPPSARSATARPPRRRRCVGATRSSRRWCSLRVARRPARWTSSVSVPATRIASEVEAELAERAAERVASRRRRRRPPTFAAAGIVVTEMSTPISAPDFAVRQREHPGDAGAEGDEHGEEVG